MPHDLRDLGELPGVSYVMPVLNEAAHVEAAVASLLAQDYRGPAEVVLALGPSTDDTDEVVARLAASDARIVSVRNPDGSTPAGLNRAIRASSNPVVVRVDAHSILPPDYTRLAVETLRRTGADNVGGVMDARGETPFERAVAFAYGSRVGLGGTRHHTGGKEGPAETVYLGVFRRDSLEAAGLFDEGFKRGQDWELNRRLRTRGGTVWFTPQLRVGYRPRASVVDLARQFFSTGVWRGELARRFPANNGVRYWVPPVVVVLVVLGLVAGALAGLSPWLLLGLIVPAGYLLVVLASTLLARDRGLRTMAWLVVVLPVIHFCWGTGFILGFLKLTRNLAEFTGR
ncbi:glycosyltransferase family 2 protein [Gryllotalpicola ginsengisoli]|uniref:glycosyltransferase family 2 protein n=1 Tax=Gryllotalpicola ginsengisoli TaxID=444608 RepID=UPI0003B6EA4B|nr:glycosyltransferase family 2 protein [Gryllotalpicola ginsengisoli]